ncbi:MAG: hypothetical protein N2Z63_08635 [Thiobacillaceae bacterium]|nr:hypothetical protein [Thiobacillaceae bacterium]
MAAVQQPLQQAQQIRPGLRRQTLVLRARCLRLVRGPLPDPDAQGRQHTLVHQETVDVLVDRLDALGQMTRQRRGHHQPHALHAVALPETVAHCPGDDLGAQRVVFGGQFAHIEQQPEALVEAEQLLTTGVVQRMR